MAMTGGASAVREADDTIKQIAESVSDFVQVTLIISYL
jgi:hypothetical protein